jgi:hypothetical protein
MGKSIRTAKSTTAINKKFKGFTDEERAAVKERIQELKAAARRVAARRPQCSSALRPHASGWESSRGHTCKTC